MKDVKLVANSMVLVESFSNVDDGLRYMKEHHEELETYCDHWELVCPGEKPIWEVSDELMNWTSFKKERDAVHLKAEEEMERFLKEHPEIKSGWPDEEEDN